MIIEVEIYEKIRYYSVHENKSQREIARLLGISRTTVKKYMDGAYVPWERSGTSGRKSYIVTNEILDIIKSYLAEDEKENIKKQKHTAKRIYDRLVDEHGFPGGESTLRPIVAELKQKLPNAFIPLSYDLAEAIQIDWGEATVYIDNTKQKTNLFCMRLCNSAAIFVTAFYRQNEESFLEGLLLGLQFFGGSPKRIIFDNAKVAVKEGFGKHAKVQDGYKAFAAHHVFKTEFCNIASGHEKGLVEGLVGYIRRNVLVPIPKVISLDELNEKLLAKCIKYHKHKIKGKSHTVGEMYELERCHLTDLPRYVYDTSKSTTCKVSEFSLVKFDKVQYSVPFQFVGKDVSIKGFGNHVVIYYKNNVISKYTRVYKANSVEYKIEHYIDLIERRPRSVYNAQPVKAVLAPEVLMYGKQLSSPKEMVKLLRLCIQYGHEAILKAIQRTAGVNANIGLLTSMLSPEIEISPLTRPDEIKVQPTSLLKYDQLLNERIAI